MRENSKFEIKTRKDSKGSSDDSIHTAKKKFSFGKRKDDSFSDEYDISCCHTGMQVINFLDKVIMRGKCIS